MNVFICPGPYWAVCCSNTRRKICLGNWCSDKNSIHGHSGTTIILDHDTVSFPIIELSKRFLCLSPVGHCSFNIRSHAEWESQRKASHFCWSSCLDNPRGTTNGRQWQELNSNKLNLIIFNIHCACSLFSGYNIVRETSRTGCKCDHSSSIDPQSHAPADSIIWMDKWCCW